MALCQSDLVPPGANNVTGTKASNYARLREHILQRPAALHKIPPDIESGFLKTFPISFQIVLVSVSKIDEINQVVTVDAFVEIKWTQKELSWNPEEFGGLKWININIDNLWCPLIVLMLGYDPTFVLDLAYDIQLFSNGTVVSNTLNHISFICDIDFHKFPFDVQHCSVGLFVVSNGPRPKIEIDVSENPVLSYVSITGEWLFINVTQEIMLMEADEREYPRCNFTVQRRRTYYVVTVIFPMVLTSVMIPLVFLIPAQTGEKMSYMTAIFTSSAVFLNYISDVMPRNLSSMPYLAILLIEVMAEGFLAMLASLLVVNMQHKEDKTAHTNVTFMDVKEDREFQRQLIWKTPAKKVHPENGTFMKNNKNLALHKDGHNQLLSPGMKSEIKCMNIQKMTSRQLDVVFFSIFSCGQLVILAAMFGFSDWMEN